MQENIFNIDGKFGNDQQDIESAYVLAKKENTFDVIYIKYNNGDIKKISKPTDMKYSEFAKYTSKLLVKIGANNNNKKKRWYVLTKNNKLGVNFDYLENTYQNSILSDEIISFNLNKNNNKKIDKKFKILKVKKERKDEFLEQLDDDYARYQVKMVANTIAAAALTFAMFSPINGPWSNLNLKNTMGYTIDALLIISALVDGAMLLANKKITKKIASSI